MWIDTTGEIDDRLVRLGNYKSGVYLVKGDRWMLIGGGGQWMVPDMEQQVEALKIDMDRVAYLFIGHSHYDHCGAVPYLQKRYPHLKVLASREAAKFFAMEKAIANMHKFSTQAMETMGLPMEYNGIPLTFDGIRLHGVLEEGERLDLGDDLSLEFIETPGHSRCSMMAYCPGRQWLFPSDSMPIPLGADGRFMCTASESFVTYLNSLKKISDRPIRLCAWEHHGAMTDEDARSIVSRAIAYTLEYKRLLVENLEQSGNLDETALWAARDWLDNTNFDFLPLDVMHYITKGMVKNAQEETITDSDWILTPHPDG